jgi:uncharacterized delta-60 repeat protein
MNIANQWLREVMRHCRSGVLLLACCAVAAQATPGKPGTLDATWASGSTLGAGKAVAGYPGYAQGVAVDSVGRVVAVGGCYRQGVPNASDICVARFTADGAIDSAFANEIKNLPPTLNGGVAYAVAIQNDGKILIVGTCADNLNKPQFCVLRLNASGSIDASFGAQAYALDSPESSGSAYALAIQPDGRFVLAGVCGSGNASTMCAMRYNANGMLDMSFNATGKVSTSIGPLSGATALAIDSDGKIVLGGGCFVDAPQLKFCALRYNVDGSIDTSFNQIGYTAVSLIGNATLRSLALQTDGKILLAGSCNDGVLAQFCAVRLLSDGAIDTSFGQAGIATPQLYPNENIATAMTIEPSGKILLAGQCKFNSTIDFCLARLSTNGTLDTSFGDGGRAREALYSDDDVANAMAIQSDGKILLAGYFLNNLGIDFAVLRFDGGAADPAASNANAVPLFNLGGLIGFIALLIVATSHRMNRLRVRATR